jgi:type II secretory pathway pseudopilin PulG
VISRLRSQAGVTITEMVVSMTLIGAVGAVFLPILGTATRTVRPMQNQSQAIDDLRNSLATIGREIRSAVCVAEPAANSASSNVLSFTTAANNETYDVTYTVTGGQLIRTRPDEGQVTLVASGLVGEDDAFTYIANPRHTVRVQLTFQPDPSLPGRELSTVMVGRNAWQPPTGSASCS